MNPGYFLFSVKLYRTLYIKKWVTIVADRLPLHIVASRVWSILSADFRLKILSVTLGLALLDLKQSHLKRARLLKYILQNTKLAKISDPTSARKNLHVHNELVVPRSGPTPAYKFIENSRNGSEPSLSS